MGMLLIAGLLVVLPALVVIIWFGVQGNISWVWPALLSFAINLLPFLVAMWLLRAGKRKGQEFESH
jgi:Mn2+/Fe2+ NRAMP family transporter